MSSWVETNPGKHPCLDDLVERLNSQIDGESMLDVMPDEVAMAIVAQRVRFLKEEDQEQEVR